MAQASLRTSQMFGGAASGAVIDGRNSAMGTVRDGVPYGGTYVARHRPIADEVIDLGCGGAAEGMCFERAGDAERK